MRSRLLFLALLLLAFTHPAFPEGARQPLPAGIESSCAMKPVTVAYL